MIKNLCVNWYASYTYDDIKNGKQCLTCLSDDLDGNGLYLITGKRFGNKKQSYYFGKTEKSYKKRFANHKILERLWREKTIYLGKLVQPMDFNRRHLELAEWCYIYFSQNFCDEMICENDRKSIKPPAYDCTIISFFHDRQGKKYERIPDAFGCWSERHRQSAPF